MASNYPTSLDNFNNPSGTDSLNSPSHSLQHADINDAVEAIETKLGIGASPAGSATAGQVLTAQGGGTAIWADAGGLVHIEQNTFSAVSGVNINDIFSATYDNYLIYAKITNTNTTTINARYRISGSDNSTSNYFNQRFVAASTTVAGSRSSSASSVDFFVGNNAAGDHHFFLEIAFPFSSTEKTIHLAKVTSYPAAPEVYLLGGSFNLTDSFTGMTLFCGAGTISGYYNVWGYKK